MNRLISFGCSYTYGSALPDRLKAWPCVLGNLLNKSVSNEATPAAGNLEILWNILNFQFDQDDICFVMWSHFSRDHIFHPSGHKRIRCRDDLLTKHWLLTHTDYDINIRNWMYIHYCDLYLKSKNITTFHLFGGDYHSERFSSPDCTTIENIIDLEFVNIDFGNDNRHPGLESHRTLAKEIYNYVHGVISHK